MITATEQAQRINLRKMRAQQLTAVIMREIDDLIENRREAHDRIHNLFMQEGVEVITDYTRQEFGLPKRQADGWTDVEAAALEHARLQALLGPHTSTFLKLVEGSNLGSSLPK